MAKPLHVRSTPCADCLFTKHRLVSKKRADAIIQECQDTEKHFVCHEFNDPDNPAHHDANVACHTFYRKYPNVSAYTQVSTRFGLVHWVDGDGNIVHVGSTPSAVEKDTE